MEKTREWIKDVALIVGHSVKSGAGRGPRHDEEQPLIPEEAHNSQVRHIAWQSEKPSPCSFAQVYQRHRWYLLVRLLGNAGNSKAEQEQLCF